MTLSVVKSGNPTILTGGTSWSSMYSGFSTTPGWRAVITDDIENPSVTGLKRLHLEVYVGRSSRKVNNNAVTCNYNSSDTAPVFTEAPTWEFGSWTVGSGTGNQLNAASEASISAWADGSFTYNPWENGTTGSYKIGMIFKFDGFTTEALASPIRYGMSITAVTTSTSAALQYSGTVCSHFVDSAEPGTTLYFKISDPGYEPDLESSNVSFGLVSGSTTIYSFVMPDHNAVIVLKSSGGSGTAPK